MYPAFCIMPNILIPRPLSVELDFHSRENNDILQLGDDFITAFLKNDFDTTKLIGYFTRSLGKFTVGLVSQTAKNNFETFIKSKEDHPDNSFVIIHNFFLDDLGSNPDVVIHFYNVPFEIPNSLLINELAKRVGKVKRVNVGYRPNDRTLLNGSRHIIVNHVHTHIPNHININAARVKVKYEGQLSRNKLCYICQEHGHEAMNCKNGPFCTDCNFPGHPNDHVNCPKRKPIPPPNYSPERTPPGAYSGGYLSPTSGADPTLSGKNKPPDPIGENKPTQEAPLLPILGTEPIPPDGDEPPENGLDAVLTAGAENNIPDPEVGTVPTEGIDLPLQDTLEVAPPASAMEVEQSPPPKETEVLPSEKDQPQSKETTHLENRSPKRGHPRKDATFFSHPPGLEAEQILNRTPSSALTPNAATRKGNVQMTPTPKRNSTTAKKSIIPKRGSPVGARGGISYSDISLSGSSDLEASGIRIPPLHSTPLWENNDKTPSVLKNRSLFEGMLNINGSPMAPPPGSREKPSFAGITKLCDTVQSIISKNVSPRPVTAKVVIIPKIKGALKAPKPGRSKNNGPPIHYEKLNNPDKPSPKRPHPSPTQSSAKESRAKSPGHAKENR